jgi:hypothetical protein
LPVIQASDGSRSCTDQTDPNRSISASRKSFIISRQFIEIERGRRRPCSKRDIGQDRMERMSEPRSMQKVSHLLRDRIFLVERNFRRCVERCFNRLEPFLFVDQISDAFHAFRFELRCMTGSARISPPIRAGTICL